MFAGLTLHAFHLWHPICFAIFSQKGHIGQCKTKLKYAHISNQIGQYLSSVKHCFISSRADPCGGLHPCTCRDHSVYAPSQWETVLQCNAVSHWLGSYTEWSLLTVCPPQETLQLLWPLMKIHNTRTTRTPAFWDTNSRNFPKIQILEFCNNP